jgi:hypothetical protein
MKAILGFFAATDSGPYCVECMDQSEGGHGLWVYRKTDNDFVFHARCNLCKATELFHASGAHPLITAPRGPLTAMYLREAHTKHRNEGGRV